MRWSEIVGEEDFADLNEHASAGGTGAGNIATVPGGLGAGFDPNGHWGIYQGQKDKPKKKAKKLTIITR